ncbi:GPI mannosyltransferase 2-like [Biomphalaria glabrata]|uniref:GPI mannosyltransferase 2 n=1 Tax=Biomphalaria glabrata TaxID=6526 RepID=A0A9U8EF44_BIOGL|nr:GPI mannosyltransferase 2-like [Biomphalaria glabrata]
MNIFEHRLCIFAFYSRLSILLLQFVSNFLVPDHDAKVFNPPPELDDNSWLDQLVLYFVGGLRRWDAVYFTHIMQYGYTYENCVAFFPFYPLLVSNFSKAFSFGLLNFSSCLLLVGVVVNILLFVATSLVLYRLGKLVLSTDKEAFYASLLFCINPASIFMTALYSEVLFSFLLFSGLLALNHDKKILSAFLIGLSIFTRSNGLIAIGFIAHLIIKSSIHTFLKLKATSVKCSSIFSLVFKTVIEVLFYSFICVIPFFIFQYYIYVLYCKSSPDWPKHVIDYGRSKGYKLAGDEPSLWCNETIPLSYSYIQKHHWNVGFLTYYTLKQLPNFLLALPVLLLSFRACSFYIKNNVMSFCFLGLTCSNNNGSSGSSHVEISDSNREDEKQRNRFLLDKKIENYAGGQWDEVNSNKKLKCEKNSCRQTDLIVYVYHLAFLTIFGCFFMHIQVLTRMLFSSSPLLYWYVGTLFINGSRRFKPSSPADKKTREAESFKQGINLPQFLQSLLSLFKLTFISEAFKNWYCLNGEFRAIFVYFLTYSVLGTVMFSNFLPWT